jgi:hypothetical protein
MAGQYARPATIHDTLPCRPVRTAIAVFHRNSGGDEAILFFGVESGFRGSWDWKTGCFLQVQ